MWRVVRVRLAARVVLSSPAPWPGCSRFSRLRDHFDNDVWKKRKCPPQDWAKPLPDWLKEKSDDSYLAIYMKEKEEERQGALSESGLIAARAKVKTALPSCVIM